VPRIKRQINIKIGQPDDNEPIAAIRRRPQKSAGGRNAFRSPQKPALAVQRTVSLAAASLHPSRCVGERAVHVEQAALNERRSVASRARIPSLGSCFGEVSPPMFLAAASGGRARS